MYKDCLLKMKKNPGKRKKRIMEQYTAFMDWKTHVFISPQFYLQIKHNPSQILSYLL